MKKHQILLIACSAVLVLGFLVFSLEKFQVTNLYEKPVKATAVEETRPVNDVDYTPQTSPPDPTVNSEKNPSANNPSSPSGNVSVSITRANQDSATKNVNIGVLVDGAESGACSLTLSKNGAEVLTQTAAITTQSGLTTCAGFTVMANDIPASGTYTIKIAVGSSTATQEVELTK